MLCNLIHTLLCNMVVHVQDNTGNLIGPKFISKEFPLGSLFSLLLFNIFTRDADKLLPNSLHLLQYGDDFVLLLQGDSIDDLVLKVNSKYL